MCGLLIFTAAGATPAHAQEAAACAPAVARVVSIQGPLEVRRAGTNVWLQIKRLDTLLRQANTTVAVTLRSDQETEVLVYKVARLGRFTEQQLTLRPGTYTALGTRNGYRDVRQSFTITADNTPAPVTIICTDPI